MRFCQLPVLVIELKVETVIFKVLKQPIHK